MPRQLVWSTIQFKFRCDHDLSIFPSKVRISWWLGPPIHVGIRLGSLIIWRNDKQFADDDLILVEIASTVVGPNVELPTRGRREEYCRRIAVSMAVNGPCLTELRAVSAILSELKWGTVSPLLSSIDYIRSCDCQCTPEIGQAGIIESRSLEWREPISKCWFQISWEIRKRDYQWLKPWFHLDYTVDFGRWW